MIVPDHNDSLIPLYQQLSREPYVPSASFCLPNTFKVEDILTKKVTDFKPYVFGTGRGIRTLDQ